MYEKEEEEKETIEFALNLLKEEADQGFTEAMINYHDYITNTDYNPTKDEINDAINYLKMAVDKNDDEATLTYARCYLRSGELKDIPKCLELLRKLVNKNYSDSIKLLIDTLLHCKKPITDDDLTEVTSLYKKSADNATEGYGYEEYNYAMWLLNGKVPVDKKEAANYLKKAADKNHFDAIELYIKMLKKGDGIPKDKNEAKRYKEILKNLKKQKKK